MMPRWMAAASVFATAAVAVVAPTAQEPALPAFEVASIKPQTGDGAYMPAGPDRFVDSRATLRSLIGYAWDVRDFQIEGGPDWGDSRQFDVSARAPAPVNQAEMRRMVRRLLAERFALRTHEDAREMPIYVLARSRPDGPLGAGLTPATVDCAAILAARAGALPPPGQPSDCAWRVGISPPVARMYVDGAPMREFAGLLERLVRRHVRNDTGLTGAFNVRLDFSTEGLGLPTPPPVDGAPAQTREFPPLFTALDEQLGLRLDSQRGPVPVIVIDSAQLPTPD